MKQFNPATDRIESASSLSALLHGSNQPEHKHGAYIGLDVHKDTIAVAVAEPGRQEPIYRGEIANKPKKIEQLIARLSEAYDGAVLLFCYEAGPCGYGLYRQLLASGHDCQVVAPSLIPKKAAERIKTDRRDALKLARLLRSGDLTAVWVPDQEQERMRDLSRARDDIKAQERKARQQLNAFLLRHGHHWPTGKTRWGAAHENWLAGLKMADPWQQVVLQNYIDAERAAGERVAQLTDQLMRALPEWSLAPVVDSLVALRGIDKLAAIVLLAELGDISRFDSPRQLMAFLGLVPSEHSSGGRRRQGAITLTGNSHARRMLIESAWSYRFPARQTKHLRGKAVNASAGARRIAWKAQVRLCGRYRTLTGAGKNTKLVCVAIARELAGFLWDIVRQEMPQVNAQAV
ncbi:IS110 family RNA-guided transposase [Thiorhodovibrio litoralis]|uniref:IS110 family transposase n=1 Tax=Thiorhodovibrio litoralis TaxID=2952932 RepID=UPI002B25DE6B|nr:IS110 family transposase [Thiorhodovibrio litoralis]WPL10385.1 Transposase IS116/IS110/IS902 family protein [Thiorhodovibrio litoralis]WPL11265.1 Transposase IS116/IS110/IS902 family protein [Thiorhodovibrio litoralis]WPL11592.1 Transposase IS116/IS110/IS902 family protein [Thiorhodovibrio litoralis]WPL11693.1 Transposase IS116/IS110/IS902 family protein [Thiorhodovibrio litoralis]WPL11933.1 Transposase IS116/IS110/IS902 family protein [Thiorhodovibrio litoralis]